MATPIASNQLVLRTTMTTMKSLNKALALGRWSHHCCLCSTTTSYRGKASWTKFFQKGESTQPGEDWSSPVTVRKAGPQDGPSTAARLDSLRKKEGLVSVRGYTPPADVADKVSAIARSLTGTTLHPHTPLTDRHTMFTLVTRLMEEFDHAVPNTSLSELRTLDDVITFFSTPVRDRSSYEDLAKLPLPPNLHIQMDPIRFHADRDTFFQGQTAFPGRPTVVSSLKYRRKYAGNQGESRNQRNVTRFEESLMFSRKT